MNICMDKKSITSCTCHVLELRPWTTLSSFLVLLLLSSILVSPTVCDKNIIDVPPKLSKHPVLIVISFDGFRYDFFNRLNISALDELKAEGVSVPYMRNQFITKTFPNHMSIATGLHAESHGVVDNAFFDPLYNQSLNVESELFWNFNNDTIPLWTLNELAGDGRRSGVMMWPGSDQPYGPIGKERKLPFRSVKWNASVPFQWRIDGVLKWITDEKEPVNVAFLYFEEPDLYEHAFGPESKEVLEKIIELDNATAYLVRRLKEEKVYGRVNVVLLSDHGFQEVVGKDMVNISKIVDPQLYDRYGTTPVFHLRPKEGQFDNIYNALKEASKTQNFSVYSKDDLAKVPGWYYSNNRRIMDIVAVADLGFVFEDFAASIEYYDSHFNRTPSPNNKYGVHGYDNRNLRMHPFFTAHGPAFRKKFVAAPFENIDLFPLMCKILDINATPNNGSFANTKDLLMKQGFSVKSPVGWAIGFGIIFGCVVLLGISSALVATRNRRRGQPFFIKETTPQGYRFVRRHSYDSMDENDNIDADLEEVDPDEDKNSTQNHRHYKNEEYQALLMSSSTEDV